MKVDIIFAKKAKYSFKFLTIIRKAKFVRWARNFLLCWNVRGIILV